MKLTEEQIERARMVNLPDFLMSHGIELKKTGRSYVMKEHDSLNIKDNGPGEAGKWYRFSTSEGGDNISFVQQYMNCSFVEAVELLNNERYDREFQPQYRNSERKEKTENRTDISIDENTDMKRVFAYLCSTRGLNSDIISELASQGKISQEAVTGNIIFKVFDENNKLVGAEKTGTSTQHKYKGIATGSAAGYGFELSTGKAEKTVFFESSIDLLSFYQMYRNILDNHRLVSMMGVKPYIVTETMQRYGIPPENVFLASDNDKAGNEFAERLMQEYPEMKRMKTPDRYKDWNDYIRNIPKEQEKAKEEQQMVTYGNEIWNKATDNKDKSLVTMYEDTFLDLQKKLDETGINYFAYVRDNIVTMAVNDKDTAWLSRIADLDSLSTQKSDVEYSPPEKNIFGNTEYRYIPQKEYISLDSDSALKMADMLNSQNISFSGRVYANGKGTLTVSRSDLDAVKAVQNDLAQMRKNYATVEKKSEIIGNTAYRDIKEKQYVYSKLTPEKYMEIKPALDEAVNYSGLIHDSRVIFTVDKKDFQLFNDKIAELTVKPDKEVEIRSDNTAEIPFDRKFAAEIKTVKDEMRLHDNLMELASVSAGNNDVYDFHFSEDLMEEIKKTGNEEFINTLIPNGVLDDRLMMEIFEDVYKELFSQGMALAAEETGMDNLRRPVKLPDTVGIKFTQHHPSSPELDSFINDTMADKEISFALASAVIEYLDDKHRYERINVPELEWYHETEFALNVLIDSNHLSYSARYDIGEGKYTGGGSLSDFIAYDAKELHSRDKIDDNTLSFITDTVVPFLKDHSQLTNEEQKILDDFKARHPVRQSERESRSEKNNIADKEEAGSYFRIYQLKDGDEYHYTRFTDYQTNKDAGANINISDYDLKYEDSWDEVPGISSEMKLDSIYQRFNLNHPNDFTGHSLSVSDVIVVGNDDSQTAYYVDDFGFTDFPEFFKEKEKIISNENISEPVAETEKNTEQEQDISVENSWKAYIIPDLSTWAISSEKNTPIERFDNIDDALKRFSELRKEPYNSVNKPNPWDNSSMARLTIGLESTDGVNAADIVHVRDGKNYLVDDFTRLDRMNSQQSFMDVVKKIADTVGIDRINVFEKDEDGKFLPPKDIEFSEWNNTFFKYEHVPDDDDDPGSGSGPAAPAAAEKKDESDDLETAKQLINRFCIEEYDSEADFSDLTNIGLAYTTNDDEQEIQISANLVEFSLNTYVDGKLIDSEMYASIADMNENVFADMDFNELISTGMLYEEEKSETLEDKPLFTDASVIEEIQKNEKSSEKKPESEIMSGDQLNMFGDPVPLSSSDKEKQNELSPGFIEKYNLEIDFSKINSVSLEYEYDEYEGGIDSDGHERKDNYSHHKDEIKFSTDELNNIIRSENGELGYIETEVTLSEALEEIEKHLDEASENSEKSVYIYDKDNKAEYIDPLKHEKSPEETLNSVESKPDTPEQKLPEPKNFIITDDNLGTGGEKTKFQNNILAIQTLKNIEAENRNATPEEQEIMSRYVGWGGLTKAFDKENESWSAEYTQLKELLTPEEYRSAQSSVLDSYFTAPVIIDSIYEALDKFGFKGGTVLEPSCGVGNFIGKMPAEMSENSSIHAVEIDSLTARMAKQLYPESDIQIKGFENTQFQNGSFDVAVGNVPFDELPFPDLKYNTTKLHDFFFAQTMDNVSVNYG